VKTGTSTGGPGQPPSPGFNHPASDDYRLRSESFLTDYCDAVAYASTTRHRAHAALPGRSAQPRRLGICDVGAYESDHLFGNGYDWATDDARERVESWVGRNGVHRSLRHCSRPLPATRHLT
jgi:hypothetical protein